MSTRSPYDVVAFGETMIRRSVAPGDRLETADETEMRAAGAESNVASRLVGSAGRTAWLSKLPDSPFARRIEAALRKHGVTPLVARGDEGRVGVYSIESGGDPLGIWRSPGSTLRKSPVVGSTTRPSTSQSVVPSVPHVIHLPANRASTFG